MTNLCSGEILTEWEESDKPCESIITKTSRPPPSIAHLFVLVYILHSPFFCVSISFFPLSSKPWPYYRHSSCSDPNLCTCLIRNPISCLSDPPFSIYFLFQHVEKTLDASKTSWKKDQFCLPLLRCSLPSISLLGKYAHILDALPPSCALDLPGCIFIIFTAAWLSWSMGSVIYWVCWWYLVGSVLLVEVWLSDIRRLHNSQIAEGFLVENES